MRRITLGLALVLLAGCSGGSGSTGASIAPAAPSSGAPASITAVIQIGSKTPSSKTRHASYVPTGTNSASVSVNGGAAQTFNATGPTIPVVINGLIAGSNTFDIAVWTGMNGTGNMLGRSVMTQTLSPGGNTLNVTLGAIVNGISVSNATIPYGTVTPQTVSLTLTDALSNTIPGGTSLYAPITVTSSDTVNSPITAGATITAAGATIQVTPAAGCAPSATITATSGAVVGTGTFGTNRFTITSTADTLSAGTLRSLLTGASSGDVIVSNATQSISITGGNLPTPSVGYSVCSVTGTTLTVTEATNNYTFFGVSSGQTANFENLALSKGGNQSGSSVGGAIQAVNATVSVKNVSFSNDQSSYGAGAIYGSGSLTITASTFSSNASYSSGAIGWTSGTVTISNTQFTSNMATSGTGGAITFGGTSLTCSTCTFTSNTASVTGGAIYMAGTTLTCTLCVFGSNSASGDGGAIEANAGTTTVLQSYLSGNQSTSGVGGAIAVENSSTAKINNSTFYNNTGHLDGGAIGTANSYPTIDISYSTFSNNVATLGQGGALHNDGAANYQLVANIFQGGSPHELNGSFGGSGYDIIDDVTNASGLVSSGPGSENFAQSQPLGAPSANGGTTNSMSIGTGGGNPAYDIVPTAMCTVAFGAFPATPADQRGTVRPHLGGLCSAGAYEP